MSSTADNTELRDAEAAARDGRFAQPLPFQFQIPLTGGPAGIAFPIGGIGSPFAFTVPLAGSPGPGQPAPVAPPVAPVTPLPDPGLPPVIVAMPDVPAAQGEGVLEAAEAWGEQGPPWRSTADVLAHLSGSRGPLDLFDSRPSVVTLFRILAGPDRPVRRRVEAWTSVVVRPGTRMEDVQPMPGDLLFRVARGEGWGILGIIASPGLHPHDRLPELGFRFEGYPRIIPGHYVHVMEPGPRFRGAGERFCRRLTDASGRLPANTMLLRIRSAGTSPETAETAALDTAEGGSAYPCAGELSAFGRAGRAADLRSGRRPRPRVASGRAVCPGQIDLTMTGPAGGTIDLLMWNFDVDGSYIKVAHEAALDRLIFELHQRLLGPTPSAINYTIHLSGFASHTGNTAHNMVLAASREDTVMNYLTANLEKFAAAGEAPIAPAITLARNPGGFDPAAPLAESDHARSARVIAVPSGSPVPPPRPFPVPSLPPDLRALLDLVGAILKALPLGWTGVVAPTDARFLTPAEQATATTVFGGSLDFTKIVITDGLGFQSRPFTVAVHMPSGWFVALNQGPGAIARDWSVGGASNTLIHELTHAWQSQHASNHTDFMTNSIESQATAIAHTGVERGKAFVLAAGAWELTHPFDHAGAKAAGEAAAAGICFDPYAYVPRRPFTEYAAEQTAQIVEDAYINGRLASDPVVAHVRGLAPNVVDPNNDTSLRTARSERRGGTGVVSAAGPCPGF